jgi:hypothetical protein
MEVTTRTVSRPRCSHCRQEGHNRTRCPYDAATATSLREAYNRERREESVRRARVLNERHQQHAAQALSQTTSNAEWRAGVYDQVADMQRRLRELTVDAGSIAPTATPTVREVKIQQILFDHCQEIPEGLYKELMDALVLRD